MKVIRLLTIVALVSLPLYVVRCSNFDWCSSPVPFTLLEVLILITFTAWFAWRYQQIRKGETSFQELVERLKGPFFWPLAAFLGISTVAVFVSPNLPAAAGVWKAYFIEPALLFIVVLDISLLKKSIDWVLSSLLVSGVWLSILAIWQGVTRIDPFAPNSIAIGRVTSVYDNPNALALYLSPLLLVGLGILLNIIKKRGFNLSRLVLSTLLVISLVLFATAIYLSKSRGAGVGIAVSLVFFGWLVFYPLLSKAARKFSRWALYFLAAATLLALSISFINIDNFVPSSFPKGKNSLQIRLCIWQGTKNMLAESKLTGAGLSGFPSVYPRFATCEPYSFQYPHNIFLNFWTELGIVGLLAFFWIGYKYGKILGKHLNDFVAIALFSGLVYIFVHGLVDVPYFKNDLSSQFWVFLAVVSWFELLRYQKN